MNEVVNHIEETIQGCVPEVTIKGLCHLLDSDNKRFPATVEGNKEVAPDNRVKAMLYHRLLNGGSVDADNISFGKKMAVKTRQRMRAVLFVKKNLPDTLVDDVINALPETITLTGFRQIYLTKEVSLIRDQASVWNDEFNEAYRDRYQIPFRVYAFEYDVEYVKCKNC